MLFINIEPACLPPQHPLLMADAPKGRVVFGYAYFCPVNMRIQGIGALNDAVGNVLREFGGNLYRRRMISYNSL